ncbi:MAG: hypothetical protein P4L10_17625 [Acidobacteriaceae bacterium]|nr:hypothetical protein [Acidobacteriaceae bacterium]
MSQYKKGADSPHTQGKGVTSWGRKEEIRLEAGRLWWADQAYFQEEGQNNKEDRPEVQFRPLIARRFECTVCKGKWFMPIKRAKSIELIEDNQRKRGGKKTKVSG